MTKNKQDNPRHTVLLIDDDPRLCRLIQREMQGESFKVIIAHRGVTGLCLAFFKRPAVVILDVEMPGLDGLEVLTKLKQWRRTRSIPVLMLTGHDEPEYISAAIGEYAEGYLVKPTDMSVLKERIRALLPPSQSAN